MPSSNGSSSTNSFISLASGTFDDRLARLGEAERVLRVVDLPGLVEAVDERSVAVGVAPLLGIARASPDSRCRRRTGSPSRRGRRSTAPARPAATGRPGSGAAGATAAPNAVRRPHSRADLARRRVSARSSTTVSAPLARSASAPAPRSTPSTQPKAPARPAATPDSASSTTTASAGATPSAASGEQIHVGSRLAGDVLGHGDRTVDHHVESCGEAGRGEHVRGVARRGDDGLRRSLGVPARRGTASDPG